MAEQLPPDADNSYGVSSLDEQIAGVDAQAEDREEDNQQKADQEAADQAELNAEMFQQRLQQAAANMNQGKAENQQIKLQFKKVLRKDLEPKQPAWRRDADEGKSLQADVADSVVANGLAAEAEEKLAEDFNGIYEVLFKQGDQETKAIVDMSQSRPVIQLERDAEGKLKEDSIKAMLMAVKAMDHKKFGPSADMSDDDIKKIESVMEQHEELAEGLQFDTSKKLDPRMTDEQQAAAEAEHQHSMSRSVTQTPVPRPA